MAQETEWFSGRCIDWEPVVIAAGRVSKYMLLIAALMLIPIIAGCAIDQTAPEQKICYMQVIGKTTEGWTVVAQQCLTPEAFAESHK